MNASLKNRVNHVVFIIRKDIEKEFKEVIGDRIEAICNAHNVTVDYAFQDIHDIPGELPEGRTKPWGTGQAVLAAKSVIDYAIRKDTSEVPPRYLVFFKAPDAEAFNSAFKEYSASLLNKDKRPSVLARLQELVQAAAELPGKVRHKEQERGL